MGKLLCVDPTSSALAVIIMVMMVISMMVVVSVTYLIDNSISEGPFHSLQSKEMIHLLCIVRDTFNGPLVARAQGCHSV